MTKNARRADTQELTILDDALAAVARTTGLAAATPLHAPKRFDGPNPDAVVELAANDKRFQFFAQVKTVDRPVGLAAAKLRLEPYGAKGLLVTPYLTPELADHCRAKLDLNFIDTAGNAYLRAPGLYVFVRGARDATRRTTAIGGRGAGTATALRVVFALLGQPALRNAPYRDLVAAADVALGAVGRVFFDLHERGYIAGDPRTGARQLLHPARLVDEWVATFPIKLRPKLTPRRFQAPTPEWWQPAQLNEGAWWGGEVAAARLTDYLRPATCTLYLDPDKGRATLNALVRQHRLRADPRGNVEILDAFWKFQPAGMPRDLVPPLLVYADLMATLDPRNLEVAKRIRAEHIDDALGLA